MLFNASERKGVLIIVLLLTGIIVIPRQLLPKHYDIFLLTAPIEVSDDSVTPNKEHAQPQHYHTHFAQSNIEIPIELNTADSATLVKIRGIGPYYAAKIIRYRKRLGGFISVKQLKELNMNHFNIDSCAHFFTVRPELIHQVDMDTMNFKAILRHPYLEYEDVQMIFNAKRKYGKISYSLLEDKKVLAAHKLKKIKPYFK